MAYLFSSVDELQQHLGGAVNQSVHIENMDPFIQNAYLNHLQMYLGETIWNALLIAHGGTPSTEQSNLISKVQAVLAPLAYTEYAPFADIQFSDAGRFRTETEEMKSPFKYQVKEANDKMLNLGYQALERLILFLETNINIYTDWPAAPGYDLHHASLLNTAQLFQLFSGQRIGRYEFEMLRPIIEEIEQFALVPLFTETLYVQLLNNRKAGTLTPLESTLIKNTYKCTAHYVLDEALKRSIVQLKNGRVIQSELLENQSYQKEGTATGSAMRVRLHSHELFANRHYVYISKYLDKNIDAAEFADYKAKVEAAAAEAEEVSAAGVDCGRQAYNHCSLCAPGACSCSQKKVTRGVDRL